MTATSVQTYTTREGIARHVLDDAKYHEPRALRFHSASFWMSIANDSGEPCSFTPEEVERITLGKQLEDMALRARHDLSEIQMAEAVSFWKTYQAKLDCLEPKFSELERQRMKFPSNASKTSDGRWSEDVSTLCSSEASAGSLEFAGGDSPK